MNTNGYFVISLDFELLYGLSDLANQEEWKKCVLGGRAAIPEILELFKKHEIHATWATVGMIMANDKQELLRFLPTEKPTYEKSNYDMSLLGDNEKEDPWHYGNSLVRGILSTPHQEIGSHTFSHYYCMKDGQSREAFRDDINAAVQAANSRGITLRSVVFPKNQVNPAYFEVLSRFGIGAVRGTEASTLYSATGRKESLLKRAIRLADAYINLSGMNCYEISELDVKCGVVNIPASRFLRPYSHGLRFLEGRKIARIKKQMEYAAKSGTVFHMWWHPHNFGKNTQKNLENLEQLLDYYEYLKDKYGFRSATMNEIAEIKL